MNKNGQTLANHRMEMIIGNLLRIGVITAAAIVCLGGVIYLFRHGTLPADYHIFRRVPADLCSVKGVLRNALGFHGRGLIQLGLLILIATPVARVALSIFAFARQRDALYVLVTLIVFAVLIYSLLSR